jgi:MFS family permease
MTEAGYERERDAYRWMVLASVFTIAFMTVGARSTMGVFFKSIIADLHWDRGTISLIIAINIWIGGLLQPFVGNVMDRFGARWLFTVSVAIFGLGVALISLTSSVGYLLLVYGIVMAVATAGCSISMGNALVAQWFPARRRGLAIGINNMGSAVGQLSLVSLSAYLLASSGWRTSHVYLGVVVVLLAVPMALLIPRHRSPTGEESGGTTRKPVAQGPLAVTHWSEAIRSVPLWQLNAGYFVCGMTVALYYTHLIPFATDRGYSSATAVTTFSLLVACSAIGALAAGALSDRIGRKNVLALGYFVRGLAYAVLLFWHQEIALYVFAVLGGLSWLATPGSVTALTGEVYGMRTLGTLAGISLAVHQIGGGASVWLAGVLHDLTGSYDIPFALAIVALMGASLVSFVISERQYSVRYVAAAAGD